MPQLEVPLTEGALAFVVDIEVTHAPAIIAYLRRRGEPAPEAVRVKALVDTGAGVCAATADMIGRLNLPTKSAKSQEIMTAGGAIQSLEYYGALRLAGLPDLAVDYATICQFDFVDSPFEFILGMNVLSRWNWRYTHAGMRLVFET